MRGLTAVVLIAATSCAAGGTSGHVAAAARHTWFLSPHGDNGGGRSWSHAWRQPTDIRWSAVHPGDTIVVDGGRTSCGSNYGFHGAAPGRGCGARYDRTLTVRASGTAAAPVTIRLSRAAAHDGTAVFFGGRSTPLPYCDQQHYAPVGSARAAAIVIKGRHHVVVDGMHRSGFMAYGARTGVDLVSDRTSFVTLRNLEVFDNGAASRWSHGWRTDNPGIWVAGHDITIDRSLVHDNGQDEIQDGDTGGHGSKGHAPMANLRITNSWLYDHRDSPLFPGYGFNAGAQGIAAQNCTHVDGLQLWGGGLHQQGLRIGHDVFGPLIAQGVYPGDSNGDSWDGVRIENSLFLDVSEHSIIGDRVSASGTPHGWQISRVTSYLTARPPTGTGSHGGMDLEGGGHRLDHSMFVHGYFARGSAFASGAHNVRWHTGDPVPGSVHRSPHFVGPLPATANARYRDLRPAVLRPRCGGCTGIGSPLHGVSALLRRIDRLDRADP